MKIYISELPKNCRKCGFCCKNDLGCWCQGFGDGGFYIPDETLKEKRLSGCPLLTTQSIKQQVRAEVVEEIKEKFNAEVKNYFCPNPSSVDFITLCISEVEEFLDSVKGENNDN